MISVFDAPDHWSRVPVWSMYTRVKRTGFPDQELLSVYRDYGVIPKSSRDDNHNVESEDLTSYQLVEVGDLVVNKMKAWQGSFAISSYEGIVSPAYFVYKPHHYSNDRFLHYLLRSAPYMAHYNRISSGVRIGQWDLDPAQFRLTEVALPPLDEQKAIADFLDHELAQIDALIEKQALLVAAAKSRMAALIESQIWGNQSSSGTSVQNVRFGAYVTLTSEKSEHENTVFLDQIESWTGRRTLVEVELDDTEASSSGIKFMPGDVLFGKLRPYLAKVWLADSEGVAFGDIYVLRSNVLKPEFVKYLLLSERVIGLIDSTSYGTKMPRANWGAIKAIRIPFPDEDRQREIVCKLDAQSAWTAQAIEKLHSLKEYLVERRQSLIAAAVTGKIDVRKVS